jgi:RecJ-like exonuclease
MPSGLIQHATDAECNRKLREQQAFNNYVQSYIESALKATCKCSKCQAQAIQIIKIQRTKQGVVEVWHCKNCDRVVQRIVSNDQFVRMYNEERRQGIPA